MGSSSTLSLIHILPGEVDAHSLGRYLVIPDGFECPPVSGADQQHNKGDHHTRQNHIGRGVGKGRIAFEQVGAVGDGAQGVPLEECPEDLRKAQGGNGQIVGLEPQYRQSLSLIHISGPGSAPVQTAFS